MVNELTLIMNLVAKSEVQEGVMTPRIDIRRVLPLLAFAGLASCGAEADVPRFQAMAETVAAIPVDSPRAYPATSSEAGLRPALKVQVMDPHALWDARDSGLRPAMRDVVEASAPVMVQAVMREDVEPIVRETPSSAKLRPMAEPAPPPVQVSADTAPLPGSGLVQLGAFATEAAARTAWERLKSSEAAWALEGLSPTYESVSVNGRRLVRLKTRAPGAGGPALCAAAGIDDPWCRRAR